MKFGVVICAAFTTLGGAATPVGLGLSGALLGFLVLNRPPARIYLGDAGAYLVGTTIAVLPALTRDASSNWSLWWAVPLLVAVPVVDTAIAILRRLRAHRPLLSGDRSHERTHTCATEGGLRKRCCAAGQYPRH